MTTTVTAPPSIAGSPLPALTFGPLAVDPPVVLAPMAGVTNVAYRRICRAYGAGLTVSEMITARALVEGNAKTMAMAAFAADEPVRSVQLCGVDPSIMGAAVRRLVEEVGVDHIDLNFGCPAAKVTRQGAGAALPAHPRLFRAIVGAAGVVGRDGPGLRQDAHGHRRPAPHSSRSRAHRRGRGRGGHRPPRPHRRAALLGRGPVGCHRPAEGGGDDHPRFGQR